MYEDAGDGFGYEHGEYAKTEFIMEWADSHAVVKVNVGGDTSFIPENRSYRFIFRGFNDSVSFASVNADGSVNTVKKDYDKKTNTWTVVLENTEVNKIISTNGCKEAYNNLQLEVNTILKDESLIYNGSRISDRIYDFLLQAQMSNNDKKSIYNMFANGEDRGGIISNLMAMRLDRGIVDALMEYIVV